MIAGYTSYPELPTRDETMCYVKFTNQAEDFELKKLFISAINILCVGPVSRSTLQLVSQCQVMLALFSYVRPIKQPLDSFWSVAEFEELQLQAMSVLAVLSPLCVEDYMKFQGNTRLLSMLDWCINFGTVINIILYLYEYIVALCCCPGLRTPSCVIARTSL